MLPKDELKLFIDPFKTILEICFSSIEEVIVDLKAFGGGGGFATGSIRGNISIMAA